MEIRIYKNGYLIDVLKNKEDMKKYPEHEFKIIDGDKIEFGKIEVEKRKEKSENIKSKLEDTQ